jgi:tubulin--tyrosine ligase
MEAYELGESLGKNEGLEPKDRTWWILKPGMSDRGQGIRLFSTLGELTEIFEAWDPESDDEDEDEDEEAAGGGTDLMTSQLRHFVAQEYIHPPLLIDSTKFHIRTYVLAVGGLQVYVYRNMLALFAPRPYVAPGEDSDLSRHLTNTCLQSGDREGVVREFWSLQKELGADKLEGVWKNVCRTVGETFEAAARGQRIHFQVGSRYRGSD